MEWFFKQANFADNIKVRYAKLKLRDGAKIFYEDLEYMRYIKYKPLITAWEDMKEKFCDEYLSPYFWAKYLPQSQCGNFQDQSNSMRK